MYDGDKILYGRVYKLKANYTTDSLTVVPYDGEATGELGLSHGFIHYIILKNPQEHYSKLQLDYGYCGVSWFVENSTLIGSTCE